MIFSKSSIGMGNILNNFFYKQFITPNSFQLKLPNTSDENKFYNKIIENINKNKKSKYKISNTDEFTADKWHSLNRENFLNFWKDVRSEIKTTYDKSIESKYKNSIYPIIHFRCSDSPFNKNYEYHIPKLSTIYWIISIIKSRGYNKVIFLKCNSWISTNDNKIICDKISNYYINLFKKENIEIIPQCRSVLEDFYDMIYCPLLVSLNSSSFSFMAGISKNPNNWISSNFGYEKDGKYYKETQYDWIMSQDEPVLHKNIKNYYDIDEIIKEIEN